MAAELIYFHRGLAWDRRSCLQEPGFLKTAQNITMETEGKQTLRPPFASLNTTALSAVHSLKAFRSILIAGNGTNLAANAGAGNFTSLWTASNGDPWSFSPYKDFMSAVNGDDFILVDEDKNVYPARITNPTLGATLADSTVAGNPDGVYAGYVSFLITFPNGHTYETGLSPASTDVTVATNKITWTAIPVSTYAAYYGTAPTIHRKLYRGPGTGGTITNVYYLATITDNTTTTYTDDTSDADLQVNDVSYVDTYGPPPVARYIAWHYGRAFMIEEDNPHRMWWSENVAALLAADNESLFPIATLDTSWDDLRVSGFEDVVPQGICTWGINLYIPLRQTWIRKQGNDPATWSYKKTYATHGIGAPYTIDYSTHPGGIIGVSNPEYSAPGLCLFDGQTTTVFSSPQMDYVFEKDMNIDAIAKCRGRVAGMYYHLLYPSGSATEPDKHLAIDLRRYPDIRIAEWIDLNGQSLASDSQGKNFYIGGSDGIVRKKTTSGTVTAIVETKDLIGDPRAGGGPTIIKTWSQLKYALKGTVTLEIYIDDVLQKWPDGTTSKVITGTNEALQVIQSLPQNWEGYRMALRITGTALSELELYSPWLLEYQPK